MKEVSLPLFKSALAITAIMYREWFPHYRTDLGGGRPAKFWPELLATLRGKGRVSTVCLPLFTTIGLLGPVVRLLGYGQFEQLEKLRRQILDKMGAGGLLLWPVFPTTAPRHGFAWGPNGTPTYTAIFNGLGFPAVAVPLGLSSKNLPLSVQIIGRPGEDETALAVAAVLEQIFGGWQAAPLRTRD